MYIHTYIHTILTIFYYYHSELVVVNATSGKSIFTALSPCSNRVTQEARGIRNPTLMRKKASPTPVD